MHHDGQRPISRILRDFENIKAPFIDVLQLLQRTQEEQVGQGDVFFRSVCACNQTHVGQFLLFLRLDAEARNVGVGEAGGVLQLLDAADLRHGLIFSLLLSLRLRHLNFMLLVWWDKSRGCSVNQPPLDVLSLPDTC